LNKNEEIKTKFILNNDLENEKNTHENVSIKDKIKEKLFKKYTSETSIGISYNIKIYLNFEII